MTEWKKHTLQYDLPVRRNGWLGVKDALKSAILGQEVFEAIRPVKVIFYAKNAVDVKIGTINTVG